MWRSFFLAIGIMLVVLGAECLIIDSATLHASPAPTPTNSLIADPVVATTRQFIPSEWMPWSLLGSGALTILYAITLRRSAPEGE